MFSKVFAGGIHGIDSYLAQVEVDVSHGLPGFEMVGLPGSEVRETTTSGIQRLSYLKYLEIRRFMPRLRGIPHFGVPITPHRANDIIPK